MTDAPTRRSGAASAVADGLLYVVGGSGTGGLLRTVEFYDPAVNSWTSGPDLPVALTGAAAVGVGAEVMVAGGFLDRSRTKVSDRVFTLRDRAWVERGRLALARGGLALVSIKGKVYALGGATEGGRATDRVEIFDAGAWRSGPSLPTARADLSATAGERYIYAAGGVAGVGVGAGQPLAAMERYDTATGKWRKRAPMPSARTGLAVVGGGTQVLALGGFGPEGAPLETIESYTTATDSWGPFTPALPGPRAQAAVGAIESSLYVATGATGDPEGPEAGIYRLAISLTPLFS